MYYKKAKDISFGPKRNRNSIKYIVIHYTGNKGDTAKNNVDYFASGNTRSAGAHFFIDQDGNCGKSIPMNRTAWSVGGDMRTGKFGEAHYYGICTNSNSVSIELCDIADKDPSDKMIEQVKNTIKYIRKHCPNIVKVIRHFDVNGKNCPATMIDYDKWRSFLKQIGEKP